EKGQEDFHVSRDYRQLGSEIRCQFHPVVPVRWVVPWRIRHVERCSKLVHRGIIVDPPSGMDWRAMNGILTLPMSPLLYAVYFPSIIQPPSIVERHTAVHIGQS